MNLSRTAFRLSLALAIFAAPAMLTMPSAVVTAASKSAISPTHPYGDVRVLVLRRDSQGREVPAANAWVTIKNRSGAFVERARTNAQGRLSSQQLQYDPVRGTAYKLQAEFQRQSASATITLTLQNQHPSVTLRVR